MRHRVLVVAIVTALAGAACSGGSSSIPPTAPGGASGPPAVLALSVAPTPIVEDPTCSCGGLPNRVSAIGRLSVRETAGVGVRIDGLRATLRNDATGATTFTNDFTAADVAGHANGVNRVAANGALVVIDVGGHYDRGLRGAATMTIEVRGTDDRGNIVTATLAVPVTP
jgi:hypothetical protein